MTEPVGPGGPVDYVVVDTDVISFVIKGHSRASLFAEHLRGKVVVVSFQTVAELLRWAEERDLGPQRREDLQRRLKSFLVVSSSMELSAEWARIMAETRAKGRQISVSDGWIAATARLFGLPLITHNRRDYEAVEGLRLISTPDPPP